MNKTELLTPCFVIDEEKLKRNLLVLKNLRERTGCKILLAQKAYSIYQTYQLLVDYIDGCASSGLFEARLAFEEMKNKENHVFSPAFREEDADEVFSYVNHVVFNSISQLERFSTKAMAHGVSIGIRINPECSTQEGHEIYDPCAPLSRLGITLSQMPEELPDYVEGIHFHTLCEQNSDDLATTLEAVEEKFGKYLSRKCAKSLKWINFGGGHHITRDDYDMKLLEKCILRIKEKYNLDVYLEPGEAVALKAGTLMTSVLEVGFNDINIAITDASAACHMPDVLEMPYRPSLKDSGLPNEKNVTYRLGGPSCLSGDIIGDYSFDKPLKVGDILEFEDMAIYTMVKTNTFNGIPLPSIYIKKEPSADNSEEDSQYELIKSFGYDDFKSRL